MNDMTHTIVPKSDQLNADDLLTGPITIKITGVTIRGGQEQPVAISYEGDNGKPYKSCKSMNRVLVSAWGADASKYVGRSMTLYCDPKVRWGGMEVGGIRISHMSDIDSALTMALTVTRANKKPFTVKPLAITAPKAAAQNLDGASVEPGSSSPPLPGVNAVAAAPTDESLVADIEKWCKRKGFDMAHDLCRGIKDEALRESTAARINKAKEYVNAKEQ